MRSGIVALGLVLTLMLMNACAPMPGPGIAGEGTPQSEIRENLNGFHGLSNSTIADVYVRQDKEFKVEVTGQPNVLALLKTEVKDGILTLYFSEPVSKAEGLKVLVQGPAFDELSIAGSGDLFLESDLEAPKLNIGVAGSANVVSGTNKVSVRDLMVDISGSGTVELDGQAENAQLGVAGSGDMTLYDLTINKASVQISGSGTVECNVRQTLNVSIAGSGDVLYKGSPTVTSSVSGSGEVTQQK